MDGIRSHWPWTRQNFQRPHVGVHLGMLGQDLLTPKEGRDEIETRRCR